MTEPPAETINPYAPTTASAGIQDELTRELVQHDEYVPATFGWTAVRWLVVCLISAVPSFLVGMTLTEGRWQAMLCGILIFAVAYTFADYLTSEQAWRKSKLIRRTLKTMYGTRIAVSIIFPVGYFLDVFCGFASISLSQAIAGTEFSSGNTLVEFPIVLLTTLIQGCVMNVVLGVYGLIILMFSAIVIQLRS